MDNKAIFDKIGRYYVAELKKQLSLDGNKASGDLSKSIKYVAKDDGVDFYGQAYLNALSEGKKPTNKNPSDEMVTRVVRWMKYKKMRPLSRQRKGRFRKQTPSTYRKAAWSIAKSINRKQWKGSRVILRSYKKVEGLVEKELVASYKKEIDKAFLSITGK